MVYPALFFVLRLHDSLKSEPKCGEMRDSQALQASKRHHVR